MLAFDGLIPDCHKQLKPRRSVAAGRTEGRGAGAERRGRRRRRTRKGGEPVRRGERRRARQRARLGRARRSSPLHLLVRSGARAQATSATSHSQLITHVLEVYYYFAIQYTYGYTS